MNDHMVAQHAFARGAETLEPLGIEVNAGKDSTLAGSTISQQTGQQCASIEV